MPILSAGILLHRGRGEAREVFLVHPGGPFWTTKDKGAWSVPKGIVDPNEDPLAAARREFKEETGFEVSGEFHDLGIFRQPSGKRLHVWALEGDNDPSKLVSNEFQMIWPLKSGRRQAFPEVDRGAWFNYAEALPRIVRGQRPILERFFSDTTGLP